MEITRYLVTPEGKLEESTAGDVVLFEDAVAAHTAELETEIAALKERQVARVQELEADLESARTAHDLQLGELRATQQQLGEMTVARDRLVQGIRQAQADLGFVLPTDVGATKEELGKKLREIQSTIDSM